jgi:hypothetical protein
MSSGCNIAIGSAANSAEEIAGRVKMIHLGARGVAAAIAPRTH